ncbi:BppU family phage baseplate upper protein [Convivina praedatoris]|uniref:BppU family phage baseplate upper protein n=1 Tax=Convivina praedatoris TaxID=2880963 RepID=UPI00200E8C00|nr:BppU family phage baseplate upper protein [Convivina sp. LMG 32447]CAH1853346.1 hypothetical protein R077815_00806 [Convivina sp. LMG 32447]
MDISQKFVQINTELSTDQATVVNAMSGRQGDNKREVFFQLKDGQFPHNLSGQDVRLVVKDAKGVLKVLSGMNNVSNLALGRFSMVIPWNFYQAAGDILDGYLQVTEGDKVISTIPIHYTVYTNQGTFVQTDDKVFLSDVQTLVDDINSRFKGATQNLEAMETATKLLQQALDNVTAQINGKGLASKGDDNTFTGSNTFTNPIKGSLQGVATNALSANTANDPNAAHVTSRNDFSNYKQTFGTIALTEGISRNLMYTFDAILWGVHVTFYQTPIGVQIYVNGSLSERDSSWDWQSTGVSLNNNINPPLTDYIIAVSAASGVVGYSYRLSFEFQVKVTTTGNILIRLFRTDTAYDPGKQDDAWGIVHVKNMNVEGAAFYPSFV